MIRMMTRSLLVAFVVVTLAGMLGTPAAAGPLSLADMGAIFGLGAALDLACGFITGLGVGLWITGVGAAFGTGVLAVGGLACLILT